MTGLVLEGGAMRGMWTSGVLDVFMEKGLVVDGAVGVSAGATFGCNYKSWQPGRAIRYNLRYAGDKRYCSIRNLVFKGNLYDAKFCYDDLPNILDPFDLEAYRNNPMKFYIVATDCNTGKPVYRELESCDSTDLEWMRASASMPLASTPVKVQGYTLLDGGMSDSIPLEYFESIGYEKNIVVLTQPRNYVKHKSSMLGLMKLALKKYPELYKAMAKRHEVYNSQKEYVFKKEAQGSALVLCPEEDLGISRTEKDPDQLGRVYMLGRKYALDNLDRIMEFLGL